MKRNIAKTTLLLASVGVALVALPAFGAAAGPCTSGFQIGECPAWVDVAGTGVWDATHDQLITFGYSAGLQQLTITNPWSTACDDTIGNVITFSGASNCGFTTATKGGGMQAIVGSGNPPNAFSFLEGGSPLGTGALASDTGGPPYSYLALTGSPLTKVGPFQGVDASGKGGAFNHATIPWAQASMLGMNGACSKIAFPNGDPQIFVPAVQQPDGYFKIVPSYDGMCSSPEVMLVAFQPEAKIPTLSEWGLILLLVGLGIAGWGLLRRSGALA